MVGILECTGRASPTDVQTERLALEAIVVAGHDVDDEFFTGVMKPVVQMVLGRTWWRRVAGTSGCHPRCRDCSWWSRCGHMGQAHNSRPGTYILVHTSSWGAHRLTSPKSHLFHHLALLQHAGRDGSRRGRPGQHASSVEDAAERFSGDRDGRHAGGDGHRRLDV